MTAQEAREIAQEKLTSGTNSQYSKIKTLIAEAAENGAMFIEYNKDIHSVVKMKLLAEGFTIDPREYNQRDGDFYGGKISW
jgi:hypothetical protein